MCDPSFIFSTKKLLSLLGIEPTAATMISAFEAVA